MGCSTLIFIVIGSAVLMTAYGCDECGEECRKACGTKQFKTCCFNYLRKRSMPDLRLEVSLANSQARRRQAAMFLEPPYRSLRPLAAAARRPPPEAPELDQSRLQLIYDA